jgi:hypothetical protein
MRLVMSTFCALAFCLVTSGAWGDSVPIQNASFEITNPLSTACAGTGCAYNFGPIPDWTTVGFGSFQPGSSATYFNGPLPDGSVVAYTNGFGGSASLSQTLTGISLLPNSVYTLSVDVGRRNDAGGADYSLNLLDGSNVFCSSTTGGVPLNNSSIGTGAFADITLTCATGATVPAGLLGIELTGAGFQVDFDNVKLDVTTSAVSTPEPSALALTFVGLLMSGLLFVRSRRKQYLQGASS